jgi:hypothetical protein
LQLLNNVHVHTYTHVHSYHLIRQPSLCRSIRSNFFGIQSMSPSRK